MDIDINVEKIRELRRCTKCILPSTMPFIEFDSEGVCNYCGKYKKISLKPIEELKNIAESIRKTDGSQDCIVMFSGGRDSSYLLHYVVKELELNPLVFTYDWGMSTPLGERNAEKMCEALGVERIVIDKDKEEKRKHIARNVKAWCRKPELGMIPLFTAGDKAFFAEVNRLSKERNISTVFIGTNPLEKTDFKTGFCGVRPNFDAEQIHHLKRKGKLKLISYYLKQFAGNPAYINRSLLDTVKAFFSFYDIKQEQIDIYQYVRWDEKTVNDTLINLYGWELDEETPTTWRIGDGTAAFYNYIYYSAAGFTENDTLRSNQIREGDISREEALEKVEIENRIRPKSLDWYFKSINVDKDKALEAARHIPKLYD
ncbi:MAG: hypothetical protein IKE52_05355 [Mogibacterium sp.]|nr:hypothetical protein [Mogibacterium sp.]